MNIYVISSLHGDEVLGLKVIAHLRALGAPVTTQVAHPEAVAKRIRYLDADLNRCFAHNAKPSRETAIAKQLLADIRAVQPDLLLDLHTSHGKVGKVAISASYSPKLASMAHALGMQQLVVMPPDIAKDSLIGQLPAKALSLEFGAGLRSDTLARELATRIVALQHTRLQPANLPIYNVQRAIKNHEAKNETLHNYVFNQTLGGYPFLVGENTYSSFRGFLAQKG